MEKALVELVEQIVLESGDGREVDAAAWLDAWLVHPHPALGGKSPNEFLGTEEGRHTVAGLLLRMQSGAFS